MNICNQIANAKIITGTYTGDGTDNRPINIGINLSAKGCSYLHIKAFNANKGVNRTSQDTYGYSNRYGGYARMLNRVKYYTSSGFTLGTEADVNANGIEYNYIVWYQD